ncbi:MAG: hypothetical protein JOY99_09590 [Sphingomonadaceae bacterium]|nr:hypothetical protein [Sphingomonadaceae bacterium]
MPTDDSAAKRDRTPSGGGTAVNVRFQAEQLAALDAWIASKGNPNLTRAMAIRLMVQMALQDRRTGPRSDA